MDEETRAKIEEFRDKAHQFETDPDLSQEEIDRIAEEFHDEILYDDPLDPMLEGNAGAIRKTLDWVLELDST